MLRYAEPNVTPKMIKDLYDELCQPYASPVSPFYIVPDIDLEKIFNNDIFETPWTNNKQSEFGFYHPLARRLPHLSEA